MSFLIRRVPVPVKKSVERFLHETAQSARELLSASDAGNRVLISFPHDTYAISLDDIALGSALNRAKRTGTRALISAASEHVMGIAETQLVGKRVEVILLEADEQAAEFIEALVRITQSGIYTDNDDIELRLLRIPGMYMRVLWLHNTDNQLDYIVPLEQAPADGHSQVPCPAERFLRDLQPLVQKQLSNYLHILTRQRIALEGQRIATERQRIDLEEKRIEQERAQLIRFGS